jgi:hypothetical protein
LSFIFICFSFRCSRVNRAFIGAEWGSAGGSATLWLRWRRTSCRFTICCSGRPDLFGDSSIIFSPRKRN